MEHRLFALRQPRLHDDQFLRFVVQHHLDPEHRLWPRAQSLQLLDLHQVEDLRERLVVAVLEGVETEVVLERRVHPGRNRKARLGRSGKVSCQKLWTAVGTNRQQ